MTTRPVALVTGASQGFGLAIARELVGRGWAVMIDARTASRLHAAAATLGRDGVVAIPGDVTDAAHRQALARAVDGFGRLDLLVNNAGALGPSPLPSLATLPVAQLARLLEVNVVAPLALTQILLPYLDAGAGVVVNVTSDAAAEAYPGWGGYGLTKAALDHMSAVLAVEHPDLRVVAFDPGDMRTEMHQRAFPDQDISDRPSPEHVAPLLVELVASDPPSGRYQASALRDAVTA